MAEDGNKYNCFKKIIAQIMADDEGNERQPLQAGRRQDNLSPLKKIALGSAIALLAAAAFTGFVMSANNTRYLSQSGYPSLQELGHELYVRWGSLNCPSTQGTKRVYQGIAASTYQTADSPTPGSQCLPYIGPLNDYYNDSASLYGDTKVYMVHGMKYDTFIPNKSGKGVPCALCSKSSVQSKVVMIPTADQCNSVGGTKEYNGYLMLVSWAGPEYYCVDGEMQIITDKQEDSDVAKFVHVVTGSDISEDSTYKTDRVLSCVVCAI